MRLSLLVDLQPLGQLLACKTIRDTVRPFIGQSLQRQPVQSKYCAVNPAVLKPIGVSSEGSTKSNQLRVFSSEGRALRS